MRGGGLKGETESQPAATPGGRAALVFDVMTAVPIWLLTPLARPWHLRWGATAAELNAPMPGDDIVPGAPFNATRAITFGAPPEQVWPWIVQLGYGRAGFYS